MKGWRRPLWFIISHWLSMSQTRTSYVGISIRTYSYRLNQPTRCVLSSSSFLDASSFASSQRTHSPAPQAPARASLSMMHFPSLRSQSWVISFYTHYQPTPSEGVGRKTIDTPRDPARKALARATCAGLLHVVQHFQCGAEGGSDLHLQRGSSSRNGPII